MLMIQERQGKSQIGSTTGTSGYVEGGGDISFANGQAIHIRMRNTLPRGSTINTATLTVNVTAKNAGTAQTCYNSVRAHAIGDAPILTPGAAEGATRSWTSASVSWAMVWPVSPSSEVYMSVDVKPILQELMARSDYQPGGYVSFMIYTDNENGSDMAIRANNDWLPTPRLQVDYTENYTDLRCDINLLNNGNLDSLPAIGADALPYWSQNPYFGVFVDPANQGTISRDTSFTRKPGVPTLRFTTGTVPTESGQTQKSTGPYSMTPKQSEYPYIFAGWIYIPSAVTCQVWIGDPYLGYTNQIVTARNQWVPFCSSPSDVLSPNFEAFWPAIAMRAPWQSGWQFWLSEPTVMISPFKQMPFNGYTPDVLDGGDNILVDHKKGTQGSVREWTPRRAVIRNSIVRRYPTFTKRSDGILQLSEPVKGGVTIGNSGTTQVGSLSAQKTISEL